MIGLDTSFLIALTLAEAPRHHEARRLLEQEVVQTGDRLALVPLVVSEFVHVITDPRRFVQPLTMEQALAQAAKWWSAVEVTKINPSAEAGLLFFEWMASHRLGRKRILDTLLAATLHTAGVRRLFTTNPDDFRAFGVFELLVP